MDPKALKALDGLTAIAFPKLDVAPSALVMFLRWSPGALPQAITFRALGALTISELAYRKPQCVLRLVGSLPLHAREQSPGSLHVLTIFLTKELTHHPLLFRDADKIHHCERHES